MSQPGNGGAQGLTREQVMVLRRPAWASDDGHAGATYDFDGSRFWLRKAEGRVPVPLFATPLDGWSHEADCTCAMCRLLTESGI